MQVVSSCPLRVASIVWQPQRDAWTLTIVCTATIRLEPGQSVLADPQEDPIEDDVYWDDDESKSLHVPSDLVPFKARADVLVVGSAFAPRGKPARFLRARVAVGAIDKSIDVWCDRVFSREGLVLEGRPFAKMALRYERAAGGPLTINPVGVRFDGPTDTYGARPIANLQPPGLHVAGRGDVFEPVGLGPVAPSWPERKARLSPFKAWRSEPLLDLDPECFNAAPRDQQCDRIRPGESIVLESLHPAYPLLETRLPPIQPIAHLTTEGSSREEVELVCDTLSIDTDRGLAMLTWRGSVALSHPEEAGRIVVSLGHVAEGSGDIDDSTARTKKEDAGTRFGASEPAPALPFRPPGSPWAIPGAIPAIPAPPKEKTVTREDTGTVFNPKPNAPAAPPLPFAALPVAPPAIAPIAPPLFAPAPPVLPERSVEPPMPPPPVDTREEEPVIEPARIGPLAHLRTESTPEEQAPLPPIAERISAEPFEVLDLPLDAFPIARCAAMAASIARSPAESANVLGSNDLTPRVWKALEEHWSAAIAEEIGRGKALLLAKYDASYVSKLEEERGPIEIEDYARLVVAAERGKTAEIFEEMTLPRAASLRIERVWLKKIVADAALGKSVSRAVKAARSE